MVPYRDFVVTLLRYPTVILALAGVAGPLQGEPQYQLHQWTNFEDGKLGRESIPIGTAPDKTVRVVKLSTVQGMPPEFASGDAARETGKFAMELTAGSETQTAPTGLAVSTVLDRNKIGPDGHALFQADFFIPATGEIPSLAVLAMAPPHDENQPMPATIPSVKKFYRFGLTLGTTPYFSYVTPEKDKAKTYRHDPGLLPLIPKPGWHRFALVITGGKNLYCYVDGRGTNFSPVDDQNLTSLTVGVMLADGKRSYKCYVDNLSIQISPEAAPLPESPYNKGWLIAAGDAMLRSSGVAGEGVRDLRWLEPAGAWNKAQQQKMPLFLFFYSPGVAASERINSMFSKDRAADKFLESHACSRIDVNQLQGGTIAKEYGVYKVPTLLVISPDAVKYKRVIPGKNDTWETVARELEF